MPVQSNADPAYLDHCDPAVYGKLEEGRLILVRCPDVSRSRYADWLESSDARDTRPSLRRCLLRPATPDSTLGRSASGKTRLQRPWCAVDETSLRRHTTWWSPSSCNSPAITSSATWISTRGGGHLGLRVLRLHVLGVGAALEPPTRSRTLTHRTNGIDRLRDERGPRLAGLRQARGLSETSSHPGRCCGRLGTPPGAQLRLEAGAAAGSSPDSNLARRSAAISRYLGSTNGLLTS